MGLLEFPLAWGDQRLPELRDALAGAIYRSRDIEELIVTAGLPPGGIDLNQGGRALWYSAMNLAAGHNRLPQLIERAVQLVPALNDRVGELVRDEPVVEPPRPGPPSSWRNFGRERQVVEGQQTLLDVVFLERGVQRAKAVCRLTVRGRRASFYGTGFRIAERTILTNHHVLHDWDDDDSAATAVQAQFGYEMDLHGKLRDDIVTASGDITTIRGERDHDFAVVDLAEPLPASIPILALDSGATVALDDRVYIVQHPNGLPKKIGMLHNLVRYADADIVQYWTDTEPGSSGAPVFDDNWHVVALHHMSVDAPAGDGVAWRNQGRTIGTIAQRLTAVGVDLGAART